MEIYSSVVLCLGFIILAEATAQGGSPSELDEDRRYALEPGEG